MSFWTEPGLEPREILDFEYFQMDGQTTVEIGGGPSRFDKPSFDVSNNEYQLINHKLKYPGIVTWKEAGHPCRPHTVGQMLVK